MGKAKPAATIHDVAKAAGVAVGSVSRALNNEPAVSQELRERILSAAKFLNYSRLRRKRTLRTSVDRVRSTGPNVGLICFGMEDTLVQLPVVSAAMHGIESAVAAAGGTLMFANIPKGDRVPAFLAENQIAGIIVKGPNQGELPPAADNELLRQIYRVPHLWLMGKPANAEGDHCNFDTEFAGRIAAEHLHKKGHRHVAFLNPKPGHAQFEHVKRSFAATATALGCRVDLFESDPPAELAWPLPAVTSQEKVNLLVKRWSTQPAKGRATAFAVGADTTAVQMYTAIEQLHLRIGSDVGLVSCNDERSLVMGLTPPLTTIDVRADAVGRAAATRLLWRAGHPLETINARILVEPVLVERASVQTLRQ